MSGFIYSLAFGKMGHCGNNKTEKQEQADQPEPQPKYEEKAANCFGEGEHKTPESREEMNMQVTHSTAIIGPLVGVGKDGKAVHDHNSPKTCAHEQETEITIPADL